MNNKKKKILKHVSIILLIVLLIVIIATVLIISKKNIITNISKNTKKETNDLDITYTIKGNNNDIRCCIKFNSRISNIEYIIYPDDNIIYPNRKKIAIDYRIESNQDYIFKIKCEGESEYLYAITSKTDEYPKINHTEARSYALITKDEIKVDKYTIEFDGTGENYYSIDNGNTWIEYTGETLDVRRDTNIIAKTVNGKNSKNRIAIANINWAGDAIKTEAYDGSENSYFRREGTSYIYVDESMRGKKVRANCKNLSTTYCHGSISAYNENGQRTVIVRDYIKYNDVFTIPEDCVKLAFWLQSSECICEISIEEEPETPIGIISETEYKINNTTLTFNKIITIGENEDLKTVKEGFDYLCDNNFKENVAIILKEGTYDTRELHSGNSYVINSKYSGMSVSIIGDQPGKTFMTSGEIGEDQNGGNYSIKLKFYRIVFKTPVYSDVGNNGFHLCSDRQIQEYYNCVFIPPVGGYNGATNSASVYTCNCLFIGGANSYYWNNPISGQAVNCASIDTNISPENGEKITCLYNVNIDKEYKITSTGWEQTGTGTNPDGTQANIGVYGGEFAWPIYYFDYSYDYQNKILDIEVDNHIEGIKYLRGISDNDNIVENGTILKINNNKVSISNVETDEKYTIVLIDKYGNKIRKVIHISGMLSDTQYRINNTTLTYNKIVAVGENEELKSLKQAFEYLYNNNYKTNVAIVLKEGVHDFHELQTGSSNNINAKYSGMEISLIADTAGETYIRPGEIMMVENGTQYSIKLKFYRVVFINDSYGHAFHLGGDIDEHEYYNCVFEAAVGGWNGAYNGSIVNTYNCIFIGGANGYYNGNPLNGVAQNCASKDTTIEPRNGTKTTCMTNVEFDSNYNITSEGWEHTGTGTNPDGTQANIGVYGGTYSW